MKIEIIKYKNNSKTPIILDYNSQMLFESALKSVTDN